VLIRAERRADIGEMRAITEAAFAGVHQSRQAEAVVIDALRAAGALTISPVAVDENRRRMCWYWRSTTKSPVAPWRSTRRSRWGRTHRNNSFAY